MKKQRTFIYSGTLGDSFIILCKLFDRYQKAGESFKLLRYSQHPDMDAMITRLFSLVPFISYPESCRVVENGKEIEERVKTSKHPYVNIRWDGKAKKDFKEDPENFDMAPHPSIEIDKQNIGLKNKYTIGLQLHSGKAEGNFKGFALRWIAHLRHWLPIDTYDLYLFGTGGNYNKRLLNQMCKKLEIKNLVGQTDFIEWLKYIISMDFFIAPEGFPAFFAMSQKIPSLVFFRHARILARIHPKWRKENIIISSGQETILGRVLNKVLMLTVGRNKLFQPLKPAQVKSIIEKERTYLVTEHLEGE